MSDCDYNERPLFCRDPRPRRRGKRALATLRRHLVFFIVALYAGPAFGCNVAVTVPSEFMTYSMTCGFITGPVRQYQLPWGCRAVKASPPAVDFSPGGHGVPDCIDGTEGLLRQRLDDQRVSKLVGPAKPHAFPLAREKCVRQIRARCNDEECFRKRRGRVAAHHTGTEASIGRRTASSEQSACQNDRQEASWSVVHGALRFSCGVLAR